ncbi:MULTISPECIES: hypothetical protein [Polyangium]|uniref:Lipoprotein n=2 Tax=Polyangium TaxID=55 RepID=A0A4U1J893_9BACT|nr:MULTISPECIES: hypothetical protein [Polyangium]MDI1432852.1 hypothetical protein [Polyangium sorediatum]TKD03048.1 hypothetical protein E8A74_27335 [Polyangium fumosum]
MIKTWLLVLLPTVLACSSNPVSTVRMGGVFPPRPADCALELRTGNMTQELLASYDAVGTVNVQGESGEAPNDPRILSLLKPEACALGGEVVLINTSANVAYQGTTRTESRHSYLVFRKKTEGEKPQSQSF